MKKLLLVLATVVGVVAAPLMTAAYSSYDGYWETYYVTEKVPYWTTVNKRVCEDRYYSRYDRYYGYKDQYCYTVKERVKKYKTEKVAKYRWVEYSRPVYNNSSRLERAYDYGYRDGYYDGSTGRYYNDDRYNNYYSGYYGYEL